MTEKLAETVEPKPDRAAAQAAPEEPSQAAASLEAATAALQAQATKPDKQKLAEQQYADLQLRGAPPGTL